MQCIVKCVPTCKLAANRLGQQKQPSLNRPGERQTAAFWVSQMKKKSKFLLFPRAVFCRSSRKFSTRERAPVLPPARASEQNASTSQTRSLFWRTSPAECVCALQGLAIGYSWIPAYWYFWMQKYKDFDKWISRSDYAKGPPAIWLYTLCTQWCRVARLAGDSDSTFARRGPGESLESKSEFRF